MSAYFRASIPNVAGAVTESHLGGGAVTAAKLGAGAVVRAKLKTATDSLSASLDGGSGTGIFLDPYSTFPQITGNALIDVVCQGTAGGADTPMFRLVNTDAVSRTYTISWRYVTAT